MALENKLQQKEDTINENERGLSFNKGFFYYLQQSYLVYECKIDSFNFDNKKKLKWKSTGIFNYSDYYSMKGIEDTKKELARLKDNEETYVYLQGSHFQQNNVIIPNNINVINIYVVCKLDPIASVRDTTFTIQNALFGAMQITKNADTSKYDYKGYGICFDESEQFIHIRKEGSFNHTTLARNVIIFGVDMSFSNMQIIKQTIFTLWVKIMFKKLMILQYTQRKCIIETLQTQVINLCYVCIIMVMIVIYLLMVGKN